MIDLAECEYLAGEYSIADVATWPWIARYERQDIDLNRFPNVKRWYVAIAKRPAVQRGYDVPKQVAPIPLPARRGRTRMLRTVYSQLHWGSQ